LLEPAGDSKKEAGFDEDVDLNATVRSALSVVEYLRDRSKYTQNLDSRLGDPLSSQSGETPSVLNRSLSTWLKTPVRSPAERGKRRFHIDGVWARKRTPFLLRFRDQGKALMKTLKEIFPFTPPGQRGHLAWGFQFAQHNKKSQGTIKVESKPGEGTNGEISSAGPNCSRKRRKIIFFIQ